jgi:hypothetical protein
MMCKNNLFKRTKIKEGLRKDDILMLIKQVF